MLNAVKEELGKLFEKLTEKHILLVNENTKSGMLRGVKVVNNNVLASTKTEVINSIFSFITSELNYVNEDIMSRLSVLNTDKNTEHDNLVNSLNLKIEGLNSDISYMFLKDNEAMTSQTETIEKLRKKILGLNNTIKQLEKICSDKIDKNVVNKNHSITADAILKMGKTIELKDNEIAKLKKMLSGNTTDKPVVLGKKLLTDDEVIEMKKLRQEDKLSYIALGAKYGVHKDTVRRAIEGKTYKHLM